MKVAVLIVLFLREKNSDAHANLAIILKITMNPRKLYDFKSQIAEKKPIRYRQWLNKVNFF